MSEFPERTAKQRRADHLRQVNAEKVTRKPRKCDCIKCQRGAIPPIEGTYGGRFPIAA